MDPQLQVNCYDKYNDHYDDHLRKNYTWLDDSSFQMNEQHVIVGEI